ncbi:Hypothetical protein P9211_06701 [Prochlorococcus marinus str. MIT 9211]|uniref:Uncharacterized protein n=2 Tax=Prochlorococcus marinus TaxID=1219 RepID=A9B9T9_PROM4|nr:Hypothetical protein P9211_06701 [Prochlorococcus marinus str. MIT 9211]
MNMTLFSSLLKMNFKEAFKTYGYPTLAVLSTAGLVSISMSLIPISKWARTQNDCVEKTTAFSRISDKVWSCSGGGH